MSRHGNRLALSALIALSATFGALGCGSDHGPGLSNPTDAGALDAPAPPDGSAPDSPVGCNLTSVAASGATYPSDKGCPQLHDPSMVNVGSYCIDSTEVTNAQYDAFLKDNPSPPPGPISLQCDYKVTNKPGESVSQSGPDCSFDPTGHRNDPVGCVDWCDAYMYCAWAGKRLCGRVGGGTLASADVSNPIKGEWISACTAGGSNVYPYGSTYEPMACNGSDCNSGPIPVRQAQQCHGKVSPFDRIFDMSGNVSEWIDMCDSQNGSQDNCYLMSGSFASPAPGPGFAQCDSFSYVFRGDSFSPDFGFRCCADIASNGAVCSVNSQCASGFCANGFCCNSACTSTCMACSSALTGGVNGTCANVTAGTAAPTGQCTAAPPCGFNGNCASGGVCQETASSTTCGAASCTGSTLTPVGSCSGTGTCNAGAGASCPTNLACASGTACATVCSVSGTPPAGASVNCVTGFFCDTVPTTPVCSNTQKAANATCNNSFECLNGTCSGVGGTCN